MYTKTLAFIGAALAVVTQADQIIKTDFKTTLQCRDNEIAVGICSSGRRRDCPGGVAQILVCKDFLNRTVRPGITMPQTDTYRSGRFEVQTCPANEFLWSRCSSGGKKDCLDGQAVNVVQCAAGYKVAPSSKAETLVGTYGQMLHCGPGKAIRRVCGGLGRNIDYCEDLAPDNKVFGSKVQGIVCEDVDVSGATSTQASIRPESWYEYPARGSVQTQPFFVAHSEPVDSYAPPASQQIQSDEYGTSFAAQAKPIDYDTPPAPQAVQSNQYDQRKDEFGTQAIMQQNRNNNMGTNSIPTAVPATPRKTITTKSEAVQHCVSYGTTALVVVITTIIASIF